MGEKIYAGGSTVSNYDGIAKQLLDNMDDVKMIAFINYTFSKSFRKDASVTRLKTEFVQQRVLSLFKRIDDKSIWRSRGENEEVRKDEKGTGGE